MAPVQRPRSQRSAALVALSRILKCKVWILRIQLGVVAAGTEGRALLRAALVVRAPAAVLVVHLRRRVELRSELSHEIGGREPNDVVARTVVPGRVTYV